MEAARPHRRLALWWWGADQASVMSWLEQWFVDLHPVQIGVVLGATALAALTDVRARRIPNALTLPMLFSGLVWAAWTSGLGGFAASLAAAALLGLPYVGLFLFGRGGAGDAKLMCGVGAWLGIVHGLAALLCISLAGVALAVIWAIAHGWGPIRRRDDHPLVERSVRSANLAGGQEKTAKTAAGETERSPGQLTIPFGVAILAGTWIWIFVVAVGS